jgi:hypothetical protein
MGKEAVLDIVVLYDLVDLLLADLLQAEHRERMSDDVLVLRRILLRKQIHLASFLNKIINTEEPFIIIKFKRMATI